MKTETGSILNQYKEKTLEYLNKAFEDRSADILRLRVEITFAFLRDDPRFKELAAKIAIPE